MFRLVFQCIQCHAIAKQDKPGIFWFVGVGSGGPVPTGNSLGKILSIYTGGACFHSIYTDYQTQHLIAAGQTPITEAAKLLLVDGLNISLGVAVRLPFAAPAITIAGFAVITLCFRVIPGVKIVSVPQAVIVGLDLPDEAGGAILYAGPLGSASGKSLAVSAKLVIAGIDNLLGNPGILFDGWFGLCRFCCGNGSSNFYRLMCNMSR